MLSVPRTKSQVAPLCASQVTAGAVKVLPPSGRHADHPAADRDLCHTALSRPVTKTSRPPDPKLTAAVPDASSPPRLVQGDQLPPAGNVRVWSRLSLPRTNTSMRPAASPVTAGAADTVPPRPRYGPFLARSDHRPRPRGNSDIATPLLLGRQRIQWLHQAAPARVERPNRASGADSGPRSATTVHGREGGRSCRSGSCPSRVPVARRARGGAPGRDVVHHVRAGTRGTREGPGERGLRRTRRVLRRRDLLRPHAAHRSRLRR